MPKPVNPDEKRAEFASASCAVIAAEGLRAATLRRVAAEAGCTTGSLTHYFPDRKSLLTNALRAAHFQAGARMIAAADGDSSALERLTAVLREALPLDGSRLTEWRVWLAFWAESMNEPELAQENEKRYGEWTGLLRDLVEPLVGRERAGAEVIQLIAFIDGLGLHVARQTPEPNALSRLRRQSESALDAYLERFRSSSAPS